MIDGAAGCPVYGAARAAVFFGCGLFGRGYGYPAGCLLSRFQRDRNGGSSGTLCGDFSAGT